MFQQNFEMSSPGSLCELALDSLGKYVYELCTELTKLSGRVSKCKSKQIKSTCTANIQIAKLVCAKLHNMLAEVPAVLANVLTNKLVDCVDNWEFEVGKCKKGSLEEQIYIEIVKSVIHPCVSIIEPGQDILDCSDIFAEAVFCSSLCASFIINNAHTLKNLRKLRILHSSMRCNFTTVEFPEQLIEFSGRCDDENLIKIIQSCKYLKYLDVFGSKGVTDASVPHILNLNYLEKLNILETKITHRGLRTLTVGLFEKFGNVPPLKYFSFSCSRLNNLECLQNFSDMKISCQLITSSVSTLAISHLYPFKNICELQISTTLWKINKILEEMGSQLVFLDVEIEQFTSTSFVSDNDEAEEDEEFDITKILKVGQYCNKLKCLHISITYYAFPRMRDFIRELLPGFQTVRCLTLDIEDENIFEASDYFNFLIAQCVNVKKVTLAFDRRIFNVYKFICNIIQLGYMKYLELICFQPFCNRCAIERKSQNDFSQSKVDEILQLLIFHCPNLRIIGLEPAFQRNCEFNPQRLKFVPTWCRCK